MKLNHYNRPLAAGFLTGKLTNHNYDGTRFADDNPLGKFAQKLYGAEDLKQAMKKFDIGVKAYDVTSLEVAIRWIMHHSTLGDGDGIILGASKVEQLRQTVMFARKGPLPEELVRLAEDLWTAVNGSRGEIT